MLVSVELVRLCFLGRIKFNFSTNERHQVSTSKITVVFTKRRMNPISWFIRWAVPRSRFALALSSHCMIVDGDYIIEAHMRHGVRRVLANEAMKGLTIVRSINYSVANAEDGLAWGREQCGAGYDWAGAFGTAIEVDREWQNPSEWFCYELAASVIKNAGRDAFAEYGCITESTLLSIKP